jgi:HEAT repeats
VQNTPDSPDNDLDTKHASWSLKIPVLRAFERQVLDSLDASKESFWRCRDALAELATSRAALDFVENGLLKGLASPSYIPQLKLLECDRFTLSLRHLSPKPRSTTVNASVQHRMSAIVAGAVEFQRFEQPSPEPLDIFDPNRKIRRCGTYTFRNGEIIECRAATECGYISAVTDNAILFEMRSESLYNFQWSYDSVTLAPKRIAFVDPLDMRAELGLLTALNLGSPESIPYVHSFLKHHNYLIRWLAVRVLIKLDPQRARVHLIAATSDRHPHIRAAARLISQQLDNASRGIDNGLNVAD